MAVSNCSSSHGNKQAGDQYGNEYYVCNWYSYPWNVYLHYEGERADEVNNLASQYARAAAENNNIGYSQEDRYSMWTQLNNYDLNPALIKTKCNADCSSSTTFVFKAIGYKLGIEKLKNLNLYLYTGNMKQAFVNAGFKAYTDGKYLNSADYIHKGGVLLNEVHHVVINLDNGSKSGGDTPKEFYYGRNSVVLGENSKSVKEIKAMLTVLGWYSDPINEEYTEYFENQLKSFQRYHLGETQADGYASRGGWTFQKLDYLIDDEDKDAFIEYGMTGKGVYQVQWKLNRLGYNCGTPDGIYGDNTYRGIVAFQETIFGKGSSECDGKCYPYGHTYTKIRKLL